MYVIFDPEISEWGNPLVVLVPIFDEKDYEVALCSDDEKYGGNGLVEHMVYPSKRFDGKEYIELYLPARTAIVLKPRDKGNK